MEYKVDFVVGVLGVFLTQGLNLLFLNVIFQHIPSPRRLDLSRDCLYLWIFLNSKGIRSSLFWQSLGTRATTSPKRGVWQVPDSAYQSSLPHPSWDLQIDALGELFVGGILLGTTVTSIAWTLPKFMLFLVCIPFATLIYTSLKIATASIAFWTKQSGAMIYIFYMFNDFAKYPISITIRSFVGWLALSCLLPLRPTILPAISCRTRMESLISVVLILISLVFFVISLKLWDRGLDAYESAGS